MKSACKVACNAGRAKDMSKSEDLSSDCPPM